MILVTLEGQKIMRMGNSIHISERKNANYYNFEKDEK